MNIIANKSNKHNTKHNTIIIFMSRLGYTVAPGNVGIRVCNLKIQPLADNKRQGFK